MNAASASFVQTLVQCDKLSSHCAAACLREPEFTDRGDFISLTLACADICHTTAFFVLHNLAAAGLYEFCGTICRRCATACEQYNYDHCRECAEACITCADTCNRFLAA